ncbi:MAG TPA: aminotransferase class V-fold PLP-dependent enzyme [Gemmatales bacterium]|nr:aminotransferase class V-fold PLP-dependent enzyme [Gemmatales bacterium]
MTSQEPLSSQRVLDVLRAGFPLPEFTADFDDTRAQAILNETARRLQENYPYHHPFYLGQMLKPPHPLAREAYHLAMYLNPNNHALDGGRASSHLEKEAVAQIAGMFGWETHLGHLTSGGTFANLEALWIARELAPGQVVLASQQAHYTHQRISAVLGIPFRSVPVDARGCMDLSALDYELRQGDVGTVVATLGTTAAGTVDPLPGILSLREKYGFRLHVDAAYGGYFMLASRLTSAVRTVFDGLPHVDSIVIDPHKHGLQPYGCGCILFRDPAVGRFYRHDSPYTYFTSAEMHLGEISLECSRPGASAVALWATIELLPLVPGGEFAHALDSCLEAAHQLKEFLQSTQRFVPLLEPSLDIVVWAVRSPSARQASAAAQRYFELAAAQDIHLALASFPRQLVEPCQAIGTWDADSVTCLRSCLMKPEHLPWMPEITRRMEAALSALG